MSHIPLFKAVVDKIKSEAVKLGLGYEDFFTYRDLGDVIFKYGDVPLIQLHASARQSSKENKPTVSLSLHPVDRMEPCFPYRQSGVICSSYTHGSYKGAQYENHLKRAVEAITLELRKIARDIGLLPAIEVLNEESLRRFTQRVAAFKLPEEVKQAGGASSDSGLEMVGDSQAARNMVIDARAILKDLEAGAEDLSAARLLLSDCYDLSLDEPDDAAVGYLSDVAAFYLNDEVDERVQTAIATARELLARGRQPDHDADQHGRLNLSI